MLFSIGFLVTFLFGGLTGILLAAPAIDFHVSDTYFVVAHFHYVLFGTIVFATFAGIYFWFPKITGRMLDEPLGKLHFWTTFIGFHTHLPGPALAGRRGHAAPVRRLPGQRRLHHAEHDLHDRRVHPRRLDAAVHLERRSRATATARSSTVDDPWGYGNSLEWATSCPPPRHNFTELPRIRSERPAFELHYPHMVERIHNEGEIGFTGKPKVAQRRGPVAGAHRSGDPG